MAQCWRCGGELPSYAVRCTWCGRSTSVSAFFQVVSIAVIVVAALVFTGVIPVQQLRERWPGLAKVTPFLEAPDQEAAVAGGGGGLPAGGYGRPEGGRSDAETERRRLEREQDASGAAPGAQAYVAEVDETGCAAPARLVPLRVRFPSMTDGDLGLIACGQVRLGFLPEHVTAALGRPRRVIEPGGRSPIAVWEYRNRRVVFERDTVVAVR